MVSLFPHSCLLLLLLLLLLFFLHATIITRADEQICETMTCGEIHIQFPFSLKGANYKGVRCNYPTPSFQLSCDNLSRTILTLPDSGELEVKRINYEAQSIVVNDPEGCLPKRFLHNLTNSVYPPFTFDLTVYDFYDLAFLRCPSNVTESILLPSIPCLSSHERNSSSSYYWRPNVSGSESTSLTDECEVISTAVVPIPNMPSWPDLNSDIELIWDRPRCYECAASSQMCGFINETSYQVGCFSDPDHTSGLSRSAKYGITIGVGIPGLLCMIGLSCFLCNKFKMYIIHSHRLNTELPNHTSVFTLQLQPVNFTMGLDGPEIEKFPKTLIGNSGRLPKPNDNTCPICLSEYVPKETLRTIPECNHYFHAHCIDEWLKMNASCPLCRNSPDAASSNVASSFSSSSSRTIDNNPSPNHTVDAV